MSNENGSLKIRRITKVPTNDVFITALHDRQSGLQADKWQR